MAFLVGVAEVWSKEGVVHCALRLSEGVASADWGMHVCYMHTYVLGVFIDMLWKVLYISLVKLYFIRLVSLASAYKIQREGKGRTCCVEM